MTTPGGPYRCPCCRLPTLPARDLWEICPECGWEDDGQDDADADVVRGGPNGGESLTDARRRYARYRAEAEDPGSAATGGEGAWWAEAKRRLRAEGEEID